MHWWLDTRDKPGLLWRFLQHFEGKGRVSMEGDLQGLSILELPGASHDETTILKRQTPSPMLDFVILPISHQMAATLKRRLSASGLFGDLGAIIHVQIEHEDSIVLGAYDNFARDCVVAREPVPVSLLKALVSTGVLRSYDVAP